MQSRDVSSPTNASFRNPWLDSATNIWRQGVAAVRGQTAVCQHVQLDGDLLRCGPWECALRDIHRIVVVGAGKATASMCDGVCRTLHGSTIPLTGWINIPGEADVDSTSPIRYFAARPHGVNEPTEHAVAGTKAIRDLVANCTPNDLLIVLISGGGSALLVDPIEGLSLHEKIAVTRRLVQYGAAIEELNLVRRALSQVKGGRLLQGCQAKSILVLVMSDIFGEPLDLIASGPTVPPKSSCIEEAMQVLSRFDASLQTYPPNAIQILRQRLDATPIQDPPNKHDWIDRTYHHIVASNFMAMEAASNMASQLGFFVERVPPRREGTVDELASQMIKAMRQVEPTSRPRCWISGGESSLQLPPVDQRGVGGRNMHLALEFAIQAESMPLSRSESWLLLSGGTDGEDGPTTAAGAWSDSQTLDRGRKLRLDPLDHRDRCDSYRYFQALDQLLITGPTHTNVCDLRVLIQPPTSRLTLR